MSNHLHTLLHIGDSNKNLFVWYNICMYALRLCIFIYTSLQHTKKTLKSLYKSIRNRCLLPPFSTFSSPFPRSTRYTIVLVQKIIYVHLHSDSAPHAILCDIDTAMDYGDEEGCVHVTPCVTTSLL